MLGRCMLLALSLAVGENLFNASKGISVRQTYVIYLVCTCQGK